MQPRRGCAAPDFGAFVPGRRMTMAPTAAGPLSGLTFAVKDLIDVAGVRTGGGNPDWLKAQAPAATSAPAVAALLDAGATLNGKTITDELAFGLEGTNAHYGMPVNPVCPDRIPGGSSSGSGVAVAARLVDFALGTDTGGSVRVPSSFVGVFGFRPTHGAVSLEGVIPFSPSYDTVGWFARDMATLSLVGDVLLPKADVVPIRKLVLVRDAFALADPDVSAMLRSRCEALGVSDEITLFDGAADDWLECYRVVQCAGIWQALGPWIELCATPVRRGGRAAVCRGIVDHAGRNRPLDTYSRIPCCARPRDAWRRRWAGRADGPPRRTSKECCAIGVFRFLSAGTHANVDRRPRRTPADQCTRRSRGWMPCRPLHSGITGS